MWDTFSSLESDPFVYVHCLTSEFVAYTDGISDSRSKTFDNIFLRYSVADPMVLESLAFFWPGGPSKIPSVCHRDKQSSFTGIWCLGGDEWIPKVPDSSRRSVHGQVALCAHMVSFFSVPFSMTVYFRKRYCSMLPLVAANDKNSVEVVVDVS